MLLSALVRRTVSRLLDTWTYPVPSEQYLRPGGCTGSDAADAGTTGAPEHESTPGSGSARSVTNAAGDTFDVAEGTNILEAAEAAGLAPAYGCRQGRCRKCVVPLRRGRVVDLRHGLSSGTGSTIQICVTTPVTDVEIDL